MATLKILITGATGLIGRAVGKKLTESGHQLVVLTRHPAEARLNLPFPAELIEWDGISPLTSEAFARPEVFTEIDGVIHLAGESIADGRWSDEKKARIRDSRVLSTRALAQAIISGGAARAKFFISGSAVGFYGDRGDEVLDESASAGKDFLSGVVQEWENETRPLESMGLRVVRIRTGIVLSRHGGALAKLLPLFSRGLGGKLGQGLNWMSWIHLDDIARIFAHCCESDSARGVFNATAPEPVRNERFTIALARALGRPVFLPVPEMALRAMMGEAATIALSSQRAPPLRLLEHGFEFRFPELARALTDICEPLHGGQHELLAEQWVPYKPDEVFPFFCNETNLEELTPKFLGFRVIGKSTEHVEQGTLIDYRLNLHGFPVKWRTRIEEWSPNRKFIDTQLKGPYAKWHHTHEFVPLAGGTLLRDRVLYKLPLGFFGDAVAGWKVDSDVASIFAFRREKIGRRFGGERAI